MQKTPKLVTRTGNAVGRKPKEVEHSARELDSPIRVLGKLCPYCGATGSVLYETTERIIYECPQQHQYETRKRSDDSVQQWH